MSRAKDVPGCQDSLTVGFFQVNIRLLDASCLMVTLLAMEPGEYWHSSKKIEHLPLIGRIPVCEAGQYSSYSWQELAMRNRKEGILTQEVGFYNYYLYFNLLNSSLWTVFTTVITMPIKRPQRNKGMRDVVITVGGRLRDHHVAVTQDQ